MATCTLSATERWPSFLRLPTALQIWTPFAGVCTPFINSNFPALSAFTSRCAATCSSSPGGCGSATGNQPNKPAAPATVQYLQVTLILQTPAPTSGRAKNDFESMIRSDIADSLNIDAERVLITGLTATTISLELYASDVRSVQALRAKLTSQLANKKSSLLVGRTSRSITPGQHPQMKVTTTASMTDGVVSVSVDNQADVYFNGRLIGTTKQWTQTGIFKFSAPCGTPGVLAIHGKDTGGPAAILASWTHCGVTTKTDLGCKCTSKAQKNWNQLTFDDSQWTAPSDAGINGADPWGGKPKIDPQARWIWSGDNFDTNEAYCRCTEGHLGSSGSGLDGSGQFHLRVDDTSSIFVNGKRVGETTARMWREVKSFAFNAPCSSPTVYAVDGSDKAGVSAFIGDINHCGEAIQTLPNRWKCSTKCPNGWEGLNFDDSAWSTAVDAGINGVQPWGATDVSPDSHWIWTAATTKGKNGQWSEQPDRACCRYRSTHQPINCNAARKKYTQDYVDVNAANANAYSSYMSVGRPQGRIWHSELCNLDGSDVDHDFDDETGQAHLSVDNSYQLFINGKDYARHNDWTHTDAVSFKVPCNTPTVYAISAADSGGIASILGEFNHCGELILTGTQWKCEAMTSPPKGWTSVNFDDSKWNNAGDMGDNGVKPWGQRRDISGEAHWIWSKDPNGHDKVFCRYVSNHKPLDCPAAQGRYWQDYRDVAAYDRGYEHTVGMEAWDHYSKYGMHEGRIWHSELCNVDGTNKYSTCEKKHTGKDYKYDFMRNRLWGQKAITFSVRAHNDAHIGFFETKASGNSASHHGPQYEIVLSGWGGTQSVIREAAQGKNQVTIKTKGVIDAKDYRQFWASAANGLIRLGAGNIVGFNVIMQCACNNPSLCFPAVGRGGVD
jgi:hypothetical protein